MMKPPAGAKAPNTQSAAKASDAKPKAAAKPPKAQAKPIVAARKNESAKAESTKTTLAADQPAPAPAAAARTATAGKAATPAKAPVGQAPAAKPKALKAAAARADAEGKTEVLPKAAPAAEDMPADPAPAKAAPKASTAPAAKPAPAAKAPAAEPIRPARSAFVESHATAPVPPPAPAPVASIQAPMRPAPPPKPLGNAGKDFRAEDFVVYPTHGVGQVQGIEEIPVAGVTLKVIVITFEENRMTLKVPMAKAASSGLRKLASEKVMGEAMETLRGRARIKRTMWSRRAQEYEQKINSGDPIAIAEVVRDLHRNAGQPDQSFSERQIYELALERLAAEVGALDRTDKQTATQKLLDHLKTAA
jgi:CarD family transcriptional regulator